MKNISFKVYNKSNTTTIVFIGDWSINNIDIIETKLLQFNSKTSNIILNLENVDNLDSSGAILISVLKKRLEKDNFNIKTITQNKKHLKLLDIIEENISKQKDIKVKKYSFLYNVGKQTFNIYLSIIEFLSFLGKFFIKSLKLFKKGNFRLQEIIYFIYTAGLEAVPIIALTSFLVGIVIAYQTIVQLSKFGADIFVVDASVIAITRELGPMITAIVVAGRSASSFSAEIGAMKLTQEIDAMKTMGFKPFYFLIIPRVVALLIALPILIFISDIIGIFGAMIATKMHIGLSFNIFIDRLYEVLKVKHYIIGLIKGPFFAVIIALIGSFHGLRVTQNTESIGQETTKSVVNAIFLVIVCDALFSVIFTRLNL